MSVPVWFKPHCVWMCRLTLDPLSFPLLLKHTALGLIHSSFSSSKPGFAPPHLPAPLPPPLAPPIPRYSANAGRHHTEPPLTLPDPSSSSPSAAQQRSWVCMHSHPHRTQMCRGVVCPWQGQGWPLRLVEEQRADGGRHALWLYIVVSFALYLCAYFYLQSVHLW